MAKSSAVVQIGGFGSTLRRDAWWVEILPVVVLLSVFGIYATFRAFEGKFYEWGPYLSPFYSPLIDPAAPLVAVLSGTSDSGRAARDFAAPATTIERPTIGRSSWIHRLARWAKEASGRIAARLAFRSFCKTSIAGFFTLHWCYLVFLVAGRNSRFLFSGWVWHRRGLACPAGKYRPAHSLHLLLPLAASSGGRKARLLLLHVVWPRASHCVAMAQRLEWTPHALCMDESYFSGPGRSLRAHGLCRSPQGYSAPVTSKYETHEHDVLIIGAGGAGLRAAIEALAQGVSVGVVCKSLLGKAHTVMAEGGIAAAMANVDHVGRLACALSRHDARRKISEQLAHGAAPRAGSP